ncbi:YdeI/OmpD-associated family protein [Paenibacillus sediminis]|uniref:DUF3052 domain-containing protein n=1 Tax=Paenibacillus sediminis TaxID=664909 RepID=A0ABS4GY25_9BACL|nr:YdeI/OmpD-associated family protein [Paenibacillus sediminis]MBP1935169.1 hypothetical protein [Paenibacillus sediminis]
MNDELVKKLRLPKDGNILVLEAPEGYLAEIGQTNEVASYNEQLAGAYDFVQLFVKTKAELEKYGHMALSAVRPDGLLWLCYPKGSSKIKTDLSRDHGWDMIIKAGYEGVSLVSVNDTWSAMRYRPADQVKSKRRGGDQAARASKPASAPLIIPADFKAQLDASPEAKAFFTNLTPSYQKAYVSCSSFDKVNVMLNVQRHVFL